MNIPDPIDVNRYKTPLGKLAKRFKASAELWKAKCRELKAEVKRNQNRANDAQRSREHWKEQAQQWRASAEELQVELQLLRSQFDAFKNRPTRASRLPTCGLGECNSPSAK